MKTSQTEPGDAGAATAAGQAVNFLALLLATAAATTSATESDEITEKDKFQLLNNCVGVDVVINDFDSNANARKMGLSVKAVRNTLESRLRPARLFQALSPDFLYVNVTLVSNAASIDLHLQKWVVDPYVSTQTFLAPTWRTGTTTINYNAMDLLGVVSTQLDEFITEYMRVNQKACDALWSRED